MSSKSESRENSSTNLAESPSLDTVDAAAETLETAEVLETADSPMFAVEQQQVLASSAEAYPVVAEVIVSEPPTQLKVATLSKVSGNNHVKLLICCVVYMPILYFLHASAKNRCCNYFFNTLLFSCG